MRSMTGYGRGEVDHGGSKFTVELNSVNRKQSDIVVNLPRDLISLEPRLRQMINEQISRGRINVLVACERAADSERKLALDTALARSYHEAMHALQSELGAPGEITIGAILEAPGVMRLSEDGIAPEEAWPPLEQALTVALQELVQMREREGGHLAEDIETRLQSIARALGEVREKFSEVVSRYRAALHDRIKSAGIDVALDDERLVKEVALFADRSDVSEELTRLESHLAQFAEHLRKEDAVGRTLDFMAQEIFRELNTLGVKANDAGIAQRVVFCKAELEKIREQVQNIE